MKKGSKKLLEANALEHNLTPDQKEAIAKFLDSCNCSRLSKNLRRMFFDYLLHEKDALPVDFDLYINDLSLLFDFLDELHKTNQT